MGNSYDSGMGIVDASEADDAKALEYYVQAADLGDYNSMVNAGYFYASGTGTTVDLEKADKFLSMAADTDNKELMQTISDIYRIYLEDDAKAKEWEEKTR